MKMNWVAALAVVLSVTVSVAPTAAEAKRLGSGKSSGLQRDMPARTAPDAPPAKPATPPQAAPATAGTAAAAAGTAAAAAPKRSWMGPIAGLAAGLGIAALMSHLGLGEAFGNFLMLALLAVAAFFLVRFVMRRMAGPKLAGAAAGGGMSRSGAQVAWPTAATPPQPAPASVSSVPESTVAPVDAAPAVTAAFVPAAFDSEGFARIAKTIFVRLQAANDSGDLDDIRRFTTPEVFAELQMDLLERGSQAQHTEVVSVDAEVLDVAEEATRQIVSVRFHGQLREEKDGAVVGFDEVWHLVKPNDDSRSWAIAGIEQQAGTPARA